MKETLIAMGTMFVSLVSYLVACKVKGKASFSISNSFYKWFGWKRIWFILSLWGVGIPILWLAAYHWEWENISALQQVGQDLMVAAAFSVMLVGVFADYAASKFREYMHVIPSYLCISLGLIGIGLMNWEMHWALGLLPIVGFGLNSIMLAVVGARNLIRWVEIAGLAYVLVGFVPQLLLK